MRTSAQLLTIRLLRDVADLIETGRLVSPVGVMVFAEEGPELYVSDDDLETCENRLEAGFTVEGLDHPAVKPN